jgi:hypothetical protein
MKYGFHAFRKGDGFYFYGVSPHRIRSAAYGYAARRGWKFVTRSKGKTVLIERVA